MAVADSFVMIQPTPADKPARKRSNSPQSQRKAPSKPRNTTVKPSNLTSKATKGTQKASASTGAKNASKRDSGAVKATTAKKAGTAPKKTSAPVKRQGSPVSTESSPKQKVETQKPVAHSAVIIDVSTADLPPTLPLNIIESTHTHGGPSTKTSKGTLIERLSSHHQLLGTIAASLILITTPIGAAVGLLGILNHTWSQGAGLTAGLLILAPVAMLLGAGGLKTLNDRLP